MRRWALLLSLASCGPKPESSHSPLPDYAPRGAVVARVDGEPVTSEQVELFARDLHLNARAALERAIEMQVMAREARRQGLISDDALRDFAWHARLQRLMDREVERRFTDADLRASDVADVTEQRAMELDPPASIRVVHFLARTPERATDAQRAAATQRAVAFRQRLVTEVGERPTEAAFNTVATAASGANDHHESVGFFDEQGRMVGSGLVPAFATGAWNLTPAAPLSQPVLTPYGAHIILLVAERGPSHRPHDEVVAVVRRDMVVRRRADIAREMVQRLQATHSVTVNAEALSSVQSLSREPAVR